jgi:hypothetical protein
VATHRYTTWIIMTGGEQQLPGRAAVKCLYAVSRSALQADPETAKDIQILGGVPVRNDVSATVYLEPPPLAVVDAELGLGTTRWEPAMELLDPGTTV